MSGRTWGFLDTPRKERWALAAILLAAFALRLVYVLQMRSSPAFDHPQMDALYHVEWARAVAAGETFQPGLPFFRAPLYSWYLGGLFALAGENLLLPRLVQCLFGTATVLLAWWIGRRAFGRRAAFLGAALTASNWVLIYFDGELLIPTLAIPLALLALWLSLRLADDPRPTRCLLAGLAWGLASIARPNPLLFVPLLALWLLWRARPAPLRRGLLPVAALLAGTAVPILPLTAYNAIAGGDRVLIASQAGVNLWIGNNPQSDGSTAIVPGTRGGWWEGYHDAIAQAEAAQGRSLRPSEVSAHYSRRAWDFILGPQGMRHMLWKLRLFVTDWELGNNQEIRFFAHRFGPVVRLLPPGFGRVGGFGILAALGALGLALSLRGDGRRLPLAGYLLVYCAGVVLFFVCSRFRAPVLPLLAVYAGHALAWLGREAASRRWAGAAAGAAAAALMALFSMRIPPRVETSDANGFWQLGVLALEAEDPATAVGHLERAVELDPDNRFALRHLGMALHRLGLREGSRARLERALPILRQALGLDPRDADSLGALASLHYDLGRLDYGAGQREEAVAAFARALELAPGHFNAAFSAGRTLLELGQPDEALPLLLRAIELRDAGQPAFVAEAYELAIRLLRGAGRDREARELERQRR